MVGKELARTHCWCTYWCQIFIVKIPDASEAANGVFIIIVITSLVVDDIAIVVLSILLDFQPAVCSSLLRPHILLGVSLYLSGR